MHILRTLDSSHSMHTSTMVDVLVNVYSRAPKKKLNSLDQQSRYNNLHMALGSKTDRYHLFDSVPNMANGAMMLLLLLSLSLCFYFHVVAASNVSYIIWDIRRAICHTHTNAHTRLGNLWLVWLLAHP